MNDPIPVLIVPTLNGHDRVLTMLKSIDYPVDQVIIIDNANVGWMYYGAIGIESRLPNMNLIGKIHTIHMPSNLGVAASWNLGIKATPFSPYWFIVNDDVTFPAGTLEEWAHEEALDARLYLASDASPWCAFTIGEFLVSCVGLFDEAYYPAYYEDDDYEMRVMRVYDRWPERDVIIKSGRKVNHRGSATIAGKYAEPNTRTFQDNQRRFQRKQEDFDFNVQGWDLDIRRRNDWGK